MRATCAVARVIMNPWDTKWLEIMTDNNIEIFTGVRYMNDLRNFLISIREGWRWWDGRMCWRKSGGRKTLRMASQPPRESSLIS